MPTPSGSTGYIGTGGGSTLDVCAISPQDQVGSIDNILSRLTTIETILSQLLGTDITAIQLSDISQDMGTILSGNFSGGALANLATMMGRVNGFGISVGDAFVNSIDNTGSLAAGGYLGPTSIPASGVASEYFVNGDTIVIQGVRSSNYAYRYKRGLYSGGFYWTGRFMFAKFHTDTGTIPNKIRFFCGLHNGNFLSDALLAYYNTDDPGVPNTLGFNDPDLYLGFQFSSPRGDSTFHIALRNQDGYQFGPSTPVYFDTGVPVFVDQWYQLSMTCQPGAASVNWTIENITAGGGGSGSFPVPSVVFNFPSEETTDPYPVYNAGFGIWGTSPTGICGNNLLLSHFWCQSLNIDDV